MGQREQSAQQLDVRLHSAVVEGVDVERFPRSHTLTRDAHRNDPHHYRRQPHGGHEVFQLLAVHVRRGVLVSQHRLLQQEHPTRPGPVQVPLPLHAGGDGVGDVVDLQAPVAAHTTQNLGHVSLGLQQRGDDLVLVEQFRADV
ncbi:hypothetical protein GCM10022416_58630 [Actinomadura keratinilytica]|uniref:Uncharacterized protein n=1 Tax=Actinomadura keratinilytica TaxID=547461 RepID=A0ABP7ZIN0_9ACTN